MSKFLCRHSRSSTIWLRLIFFLVFFLACFWLFNQTLHFSQQLYSTTFLIYFPDPKALSCPCPPHNFFQEPKRYLLFKPYLSGTYSMTSLSILPRRLENLIVSIHSWTTACHHISPLLYHLPQIDSHVSFLERKIHILSILHCSK
jgi:hypothetical protein